MGESRWSVMAGPVEEPVLVTVRFWLAGKSIVMVRGFQVEEAETLGLTLLRVAAGQGDHEGATVN